MEFALPRTRSAGLEGRVGPAFPNPGRRPWRHHRRHEPPPRVTGKPPETLLQHTTSDVAHKAAFEEKRTWVDPQL